jgi:hypothetical protein
MKHERPSPQQRLIDLVYLDTVEDLIGKGPLPSQTQLSGSLKIRRQTISEWRRSLRFMEDRIELGDALCDLANQRMAEQGAPPTTR